VHRLKQFYDSLYNDRRDGEDVKIARQKSNASMASSGNLSAIVCAVATRSLKFQVTLAALNEIVKCRMTFEEFATRTCSRRYLGPAYVYCS